MLNSIYKITNIINGKVYIGKTSLSIEDRYKQHIRDSKKSRTNKRPLYDAMNKYGIDNFIIEEIETNISDDDINDKEVYYIQKFHSYIGDEYCNGYNATLGGDSKKYKKYDIDVIINLYRQGYTCCEISEIIEMDRTYIAKLLKNNNINILMTKQKFSKRICKIDINSGNLLYIFDSLADAAKDINVKYTANIRRAAKGEKQKTAYGYKWMYYDDYLKLYT